MEMRSGRVTGASDISDGVSLIHGLSLTYRNGGHVAIQRHIAVAMVDHDAVTVAAVP